MNTQHTSRDHTSHVPQWLEPHREVYPFEPRYTQVNGHRMGYVDVAPSASSGVEATGALMTPTVMIHGNPTWSLYYRGVIDAVSAAGGRALAPDHIGCGLSDKPSEREYDYTLSRRVSDLEAWFEAVGLSEERVNLIVHDWGGMIGMAYATRHPERINRLIVLNTAAFHIPEDKRLPATLWLGRNTRLGQALIQGLNAFSGVATRWACMKPLSQAVRRAYVAPYHSWATRIATHRFVRDIPLKPDDPAYATVSETQAGLSDLADKPMLIGWGLKDFVFDETFLRVWRARFPNAEAHIYPNSGHYILEDERDDLIPRIVDFLS